MYQDYQLTLADGQDVTETAGTRKVSTNIIDLSVAGDADQELFLYGRIATAISQASTNGTVTFSLETHTAANFSSERTVLWKSAAIPEATLVAGYEFAKLRIPRGLNRYVALVLLPTTQDIASGAIDAFLTPAIDTNQ